jgi:hypothetical protein
MESIYLYLGMHKPYHTIARLFALIFLIVSCAKEYSYEKKDVIATPVKPKPSIHTCTECIGKDSQLLSRWSFYNDTTFYCGQIDTAIVLDRTGFTIYGPSSCSQDSGLVILVRMGTTTLDHDFYNTSFPNTSFYYYDRLGSTHAFITHYGTPFDFTIESYIHQTKIAVGSFNGFAYRPDGTLASIQSGKFKVRLLY